MRIPFSLLKTPFHTLRPTLVQPLFWALFLLSPLLNVFRVDMIAQRLWWLWQTYPLENNHTLWLPIGFYACVLVVAVSTAFLGRVFCGWVCPHNTMTEWTRWFRGLVGIEPLPVWLKRLFQKHPQHTGKLKVLGIILGLVWPVVITFLLFHYVVPIDWMLGQYLSGKPNLTLVFGHVLFSVMGLYFLLAGHLFCKTTCPYGLAQSVSAYQTGKWRPMEILFTPREANQDTSVCGTCTACAQVCPVDIDPRGPVYKVGQFMGCWNCGECIDACTTVHQKKGGVGLLRFRLPFG